MKLKKTKQNKSLLSCGMNRYELELLGLPGDIMPKRIQEIKRKKSNTIKNPWIQLYLKKQPLGFLVSSANELP